jgi:hypothetical protein
MDVILVLWSGNTTISTATTQEDMWRCLFVHECGCIVVIIDTEQIIDWIWLFDVATLVLA